MLESIKVHHLELFKDAEAVLSQINAVSGVNKDNKSGSSNGCGKSTFAKNAITFNLYGEVPGLTLQDLVHDDTKEMYVEGQYIVGSDKITIKRSVPSDLKILVNGKESDLNTATLKQKWINDTFGAYDYFKKYRMVDLKGINLLDSLNDSRGITTLKKELMTFIDDVFTDIRKRLLAKKLERETYNVDKRLYKFFLSEKKMKTLECGLQQLQKESNCKAQEIEEQNKVVNNIVCDIRTVSTCISVQKIKLADAQKTGICPILKKQCAELKKEIPPEQKKSMEDDIVKSQKVIEEGTEKLEPEQEYLNELNRIYDNINNKIRKTERCIMKLKEAYKFLEYKYTKKDVMLFDEAIKVLDGFAGYYINDWLGALAVIINDLLKNINLSIEFSQEKEFMKVYDNGKSKKYAQLSSGQKTLLSAIFKLAILLHKGENDGIILCDEGLSDLDFVNLRNFIDICNNLNFQIILVYQNIPEIENVNVIRVERENNESRII